MMPPRLLVFDLDGTLIDSRVDLCNSVNATLIHFGKQPLPDSIVAGYIGDGAAMLVRRALAHAHAIHKLPDPHDDALIAQAVDWFLDYYRVHKLDFTRLYPGVNDALTAIRAAHPTLPMAVLTNKPVNPSRAICAGLGIDRFFFQNYGGNSFATKKPDPEGLLALIAEANAMDIQHAIAPSDTVMIGDSAVDIHTARNAGTRSLGCTFGISPDTLAAAHPDATVDSAFDWPQALGLLF
jgi:phosphoglycolate phosphatase